jgi:hypothetical protein
MTTALKAIGFKLGGNANMTSLQGYIRTSYDVLRGCFGPTTDQHDDYKSDASWTVTFADGVVVTIYNWKDGHAYCGADGLDVEDITEWHIGGHNGTGAESRVKEVVGAYLESICHQQPAIEYYGA